MRTTTPTNRHPRSNSGNAARIRRRVQRPAGDNQVLGFAEIVDFIYRSWKIIASTTLIVFVVTVGSVFVMTPRYSATSEVLLETPRENVLGADGLSSGTTLSSAVVESQLAILVSKSLLRRVAVEKNLSEDPEFGGTTERTWFGEIVRSVLQSLKSSPGEPKDRLAVAVEALGDAVDVSRAGLSNVMKITVSASEPKKAAMLANALANAYLVDQLEARFEGAQRASTWLNERQKVLQAEVASAEAAVEEFRTKNNLIATKSGSITEQQLSEINSALINARAETAAKRSIFEQVQKLVQAGGDIQALPDVLKTGLVSELRTRLATLAPAEADLRSRYGERHPELVKVLKERQEIEAQIRVEIGRAIENLKNELETAQSREASLAQSLTTVSNQSGVDNQVAVKLRELERIATANKQVYESFLSRARIAEEETRLPTTEARIISAAGIPDTADFPPKKLFAILGLLMGGILGTGIAVLRELFNSGFMAQRQVQDLLDLPVLASLPRVPDWEERGIGLNPRKLDDLIQRPSHRYVEAIRSLRFGVDTAYLPSNTRSRVVQITSTMPGEGKTTLAVSLACSAAAAGEMVLLVDADLRLSAVSRIFNKRNAIGLVDVLTSSEDVLNAIYYDERSGIHILPAGARAQNPPALLDSARMWDLIEYAKSNFDKIIIDSPPVAVAVDAAAVSRCADSIVFGVKWKDTPREAVSQAIMQLPNSDRVAGIVLTMVDETKLPRYGRYLSLDSKLVEKYGYNGSGYLAFSPSQPSREISDMRH